MATDVYRPERVPDHKCSKEINPKAPTTSYPYMVLKKEEPAGLIRRCSCGTLWVLKHFHLDYNEWARAGLKLRIKHRNDGWEGVNNESY